MLAGRYALLAAGAAFAVPMFLGGGAGPVLPGWVVVAAQDAAPAGRARRCCGARVPLLRPDRFVEVGWLVLLPAVLLQVLVVSVLVCGRDVGGGPDVVERCAVVQAVVFWVLAVVAVAAGVAVFRVDSMARATYALAVSFVAVGLALLLVDLHYVGVITVLMMVMEMAVMAVYMVMFMGMNPALMPMDMVHDKRWAAAAATVAFLVLAGGALLVPWPVRRGVPPEDTTRALGEAVMGPHMLVMLTAEPGHGRHDRRGRRAGRARGRYDRLGDELDRRPADDPQPGGVGR